MSGVAVGADGAVFRNVPGVVAGLPGQWVTERVEHVEQDPGDIDSYSEAYFTA